MSIKLPKEFIELIAARDKLRAKMNAEISKLHGNVKLNFTFDGNLVGDIGEALAAKYFGIKLVDTRCYPGIDGFSKDGKSVQVKATGTGRGPAFSQSETKADLLLFFDIDFNSAEVDVVFNGPERYVRSYLPEHFVKLRALSKKQIREADKKVQPSERLMRIDCAAREPE